MISNSIVTMIVTIVNTALGSIITIMVIVVVMYTSANAFAKVTIVVDGATKVC